MIKSLSNHSKMSTFSMKNALTILLSISFVLPVIAVGQVSGTLTSGRWTPSDSPIIVTGNIILPNDAELIIEPGVRIEFAGPYHFEISGNLRAEGTREDSIVFTAQNRLDPDSRWRGLRFINASRNSTMKFCRIEYGWAKGDWPFNCGGAVYLERSSITIERCDLRYNRADRDGGAIYGWFTTATIKNNVIAHNYADNFGGGLYLEYSSPTLQNITVAFDTARGWGGGMFLGANATPNITNSIFTHNVQHLFNNQLQAGDVYFPDLARSQSAEPNVNFSCISASGEAAYAGVGNVVLNPEYRQITNHPYNFKLAYSSPCIDAGDPRMSASGEPDRLVNRINMGAYGGTEDATVSTPVFFNDRIDLGVSIGFDSIRINTQASREINIQNIGHWRMFVRELRFSSDAFFPDSIEVDDVMIPSYLAEPIEPGERMKIGIHFIPTELRTYDATITFITSDTTQPPPVLRIVGTGIDPVAQWTDNLDFGKTLIGSQVTRQVVVRNTGRSELRLSNATIQGSDEFKLRILNSRIAPNDQGSIEVTFAPVGATTYEGYGSVRSNDRNVTLSLRGIGTGPNLGIEIDTLFMGYVYYNGDTARYNIPISNDGDSALIINNLTVTNDAFSADIPNDGIRFEARENGNIPIRFHPPRHSENFNALLIIHSNFPKADTVKLSGRGMAEPGRYMFGNVTGAWEWSLGQVDYIVLDSVIVPAHQRLRVMPGSRILFEPGAWMRVDGELRAIGTSTDSIYFLPRSDAGTPDSRWVGLELLHEDNTRLTYCVINGMQRGISIRESSPIIRFSKITSNGVRDSLHNGGGFYLENSGAQIIGCEISDNFALRGGAIFGLNSKPVISNNIIFRNEADHGSAIYLQFQSTAVIQNNKIFQNTSRNGSSVALYDHSNPWLINNVIVDNIGNGIESAIRSLPLVLNSVVWDNTGSPIVVDNVSNVLASYNDITGGFRGSENLNIEPGFVNANTGNFLLADDSPLIDKGNPEPSHRDYFFPPSKGSARNDIGAYGGPLGGLGRAPEISISVYQNSAFPKWLDFFIVSDEPFTSAPICSVEWVEEVKLSIPTSQLGERSYRGSWEVPGAGTLFITAEGELTGIGRRKIGRTYQINIITPILISATPIAGVNGHINIPSGSTKEQIILLAGSETRPQTPENDLMFLSPKFFISGISGTLDKSAEIVLEFNSEGWNSKDLERLGIYRYAIDHWVRLQGGYRNNQVIGVTDKGGEFILALDDNLPSLELRAIPEKFEILQVFPNPFNNSASIKFALDKSAKINLSIFDLSGRKVTTLTNGWFDTGSHIVNWNGKDFEGKLLSSGIYWARLEGIGAPLTKKLLLLR